MEGHACGLRWLCLLDALLSDPPLRPPPCQVWAVPELHPSYFTDPSAWWNQPSDRYGHGPFDILTPALADAFLRANASSVICQALGGLLDAAASNPYR